MKIRSFLIATVALCAMAAPALAGASWSCVTDTNISYERGGEKNPTQTCKSLADCPVPSSFASLSGQVSNAANDGADDHFHVLSWKNHVIWSGESKPHHEGACS